jgi:hypothetical protein
MAASTPNPDGPIVFIERYYEDAAAEVAPWSRMSRVEHPESEWEAVHFEGGTVAPIETADFDEFDDALAWARARADSIVVRLGNDERTHYSAGLVHERRGEAPPYPPWPPDSWPEYDGPPGSRQV